MKILWIIAFLGIMTLYGAKTCKIIEYRELPENVKELNVKNVIHLSYEIEVEFMRTPVQVKTCSNWQIL